MLFANERVAHTYIFLLALILSFYLWIHIIHGHVGKKTHSLLYRSIPFKMERSYSYYPWDDGLDYEGICLKMKEYISRNESRTIHCSAHQGGLGHKYRSISLSIIYAFLLERKFNLIVPDNILNTTQNCFNFPKQKRRKLGIPAMNSTACHFISANKTIESLFGDQDVELLDCRIPLRLEERFLNITFNSFLKVVFRILLNPIPEIQFQVQKYKYQYFSKYNHTLGIQIRTGGCLADCRETREMSSIENLVGLPNYIQDVMQKTGMVANSTLIYIATDSTIAENYLRGIMGYPYHFLSANIFKRSHSFFNPSDDVMKRNLVDLHLLAECDALIYFAGSGFGNMAYQLSKSNHKFMYRVTRRDLPVINRNVQCDESIIEWLSNQTKKM